MGVRKPLVMIGGVVRGLPDGDFVSGGFMSAADKTKLDGIADGANNYTHPANHPASIIAQDASNRFVTDAEKSTWNGKADGTHSHSFASITGKPTTLAGYGITDAQASISAGTTAQYFRGDKTWRDFFTDVRAATLTGLSTATNAAIAAADTVLVALGKLQAQVNAKFDKTGGDISGNVNIPSLNGGQLAGFRNKIINGSFGINQRAYVSGAITTAGQYTLDRWKVTGTGGVTFSTTNNKTTVTIPSGQTFQQVVEGLSLESGAYVLSWEGTAQGRINGGAYGASGAVTATITGGANTTIEFNAGTVALVMFEKGSVATPFEHRPYGLELALCQRYYYRLTQSEGVDIFGPIYSVSATTSILTTPVNMRVAPVSLDTTGVATDYRVTYGSTSTVCSTVPVLSASSTNLLAVAGFPVTSGITAGQAGSASSPNGVSYLGFSAEL